jgi:hypothetical protein
MAHFAHRRVGTLLVVVQDAQTPGDDEWQRYLDECRKLDLEQGGFANASALIFTDGGVPNGTQRVALTKLLQGRTALSAVVSESLLVRAGLSVLSMLNNGLKVFPSKEWKQAAAFARVPEAQHLDVLKVAVALGREVGDPKVLRLIGL